MGTRSSNAVRALGALGLTASVLLFAAACGDDDDRGVVDGEVACADRDPLRNVYFGDLHVHTALSFDSYAFDIRNSPDDAYRFAQGGEARLPPLDAAGVGTQLLRLDRPLDFAAVTDHAEFLGEVDICLTPGLAGHDAQVCRQFRDNGSLGQTLMGIVLTSPSPMRDAEICGAAGRCVEAARSVWGSIVHSAEAYYDRSESCTFTTLVGYEHTANTGASARHRNVIFRGDRVPFPTSYMEEPRPEGLWAALRRDCIDAGIGCDAITIPHNSNQSNGNMFAIEYPAAADTEEERQQARQRAAIEPLVEIYQHKGDSECSNGFGAVFGLPDELCEFEKLRPPPFEVCGDEPGSGGVANGGCVSPRDFVRGALLAGLEEQSRIGVNPLRLGIIASTDTHNGTPGSVDEYDWRGHRGNVDDVVEKRLGDGGFRAGPIFNPGGLTAVWAEENRRESIFAALKRREVYGTSGPRMVVRMFAGWDLPENLCDHPDAVARADAAGVPMGGVLADDGRATAPRLFVTALRDPGTAAHPGSALQRIQVIKGWSEGGVARYRVFDVAGDAANGASVDDECVPRGTGFDSLCAVWSDPDFDTGAPAFYYARVVENPSCRWNARQCLGAPSARELPGCEDPTVVRVVQERAWTSPIWYDGE